MSDILGAVEAILIKPVGPDCNCSCEYCFYSGNKAVPPATGPGRMEDKVLEAVICQAVADSGAYIAFSWQGGEPTLAGLDFYKKAVGFQIKYGSGKIVSNGLQTNGLLINKQWADFLSDYRFLVGLSIDGPADIHDKYRIDRRLAGTLGKAIEKKDLLLDAGVAVNSLSVVTDYSARCPDEIYGFLKGHGIRHMQFIPICGPRIETVPSAESYGNFLCRIFDLWKSDFINGVPSVNIRLFDSLLYCFVDRKPPECTLLDVCGNYLVVERNGDVFPCDFFVEPRWRLGNVLDGNPLGMMQSISKCEFGSRKSDLAHECKACPFLRLCRGGCIRERDSSTRVSRFCQSYKAFFSHALGFFVEMAEKISAEGKIPRLPHEKTPPPAKDRRQSG